MAEAVDCSECGTRYDSQQHPFCPRCGSTARGAPVPGALAAAVRHDPRRRRVQAAGGVLLAVGLLFLVSAGISLLIPVEEAAAPLAESFAGQPGGALALRFPTAEPANVTLTTPDGKPVANGTAADGVFESSGLASASVTFTARQGDASWNGTAVVLPGDRLEVDLPAGGGEVGLHLSGDLVTATKAARIVLLVLALALAAGGVAALLLRAFAVAAAGALVGAFLGLVAVVGFLALGLLFAIPFGACAYFILKGRRHFRRRSTA